ncbi:MAG: LLM class flavin-dependent oxidoreductase [Candidatus Binatus sp.]|uniref:LLM class flavin-dependent oxidoreductase n=1 Tax=Candidatus Binatus sp. TaxID=2811406 RepID=UPI00271BDB93|nr:LLM class flavin-dependent oxidoreductase [Candidatus Binatus sp.]MDO8434285.1 LLM class flavin-dependent oxidoreductase [Candidatus Binatus sp.]
MKKLDPADSRLRLGLFYPNTPSIHVTSRAVADANPDPMEMATHRAIAQAAEQIGLDYLFLADRWAPYDRASTLAHHQDPMLAAFILGAALIGITERIGIITTLHTTYFHPAHIARIGANLDRLSGGRWGWNVVTGLTEAEMRMFGFEGEVEHDRRYEMAVEMIDLVKKLWDGMRREDAWVDWKGKHYTMKGAVVGPGPLQAPFPLLVNAGASEAGQRLAARHCDYLFLTENSAAAINARMEQTRKQVVACGRGPDELSLMTAARVIVRDTQREADEVLNWITENIDLDAARAFAAGVMSSQSIRDAFAGFTDEQVVRAWGGSMDPKAARFCGPPGKVAGEILSFCRETGCRGLLLTFPLWHEREIRRFGEQVMPLLAKSGAWIHPSQRDWNW